MAPRLSALERAAGDAGCARTAAVLHAHLVACPDCLAKHGTRLRALEGLVALRSREVPEGLLADLKTRVLTGVRTGAPGGMSPAFLDAPASLARWRRVALAASVLLAVGAGLFATGRLTLREPQGSGDIDLRDSLLPRLDLLARRDLRRQLEQGDDMLQPVLLPGRGMNGFFAAPREASGVRGRAGPPRPLGAAAGALPEAGNPDALGVDPWARPGSAAQAPGARAPAPRVPQPDAPETGD